MSLRSKQFQLLKGTYHHFTSNYAQVLVQHRSFGVTAMRAWFKRQEKLKFDKKFDDQELMKSEFENLKKWRANELYDNNPQQQIKIPDIQSMFELDKIQSTINAIDNQQQEKAKEFAKETEIYDNYDASAVVERDIELEHAFQIYSMFIIERLPIINRQFEHELEYRRLLRGVKFDQPSMPSLFKELYIDKINKQEREKEKSLKIRPRITIEDVNEEYHSLNRNLDLRLYLICKLRDKQFWEFPWSKRQFDETLFECAQRALTERVGPYLHYATIDTQPFGHSQFEAAAAADNNNSVSDDNQDIGDKDKGTQLFFQKAYYVKGNGRANINEHVQDFGWFTKSDLQQKLNPVLWQSINRLLME